MASPPLIDIIGKLLVPDNAILQQGSRELSEAFKSPTVISELCQILCGSPTPQYRQYAGVLLRRRLGKIKYWVKLDSSTKNGLKDAVLPAVINESTELVRNTVTQLIGTIAKHELPSGEWPGFFEFLTRLLRSQNQQEQQLGIYIVSIVSGVAGEQLGQHLTQLLHLFPAQLTETSSQSAFYTIQALTNFAPFVSQDHMEAYMKLLPGAIEFIRKLVSQDAEKASQSMDLFDVLAECEVALLVPQLRTVLQLCLEIASDPNLGDPLRAKSISFLSYIIRIKKKYIIKNKLAEPIVKTLYKVACEGCQEEEEGQLGCLLGGEIESGSPVHSAAQAIDSCSMHLPPEKFLSILLPLVDASLKSEDPLQVKGAYLALAMAAEGCSDTLRTKHLHQLLQCISRGLTSDKQVIKHGALFALGQFAEHLQPDISKYHTELLPVLNDFLRQVCTLAQNGSPDPTGIDRMFYALEVFCEHLEDELHPHLPPLMECLLSILSIPTSIHLKELAISAIGAAANAAKTKMMDYFEKIVELLKGYLTEDQPDDKLTLQVQSIDTLAQLSRSLGSENFVKYADECCALGMGLLERKDDPDVRKTCYMLFASLASVIKGDLSPHLPKLVDYMMTSLRSSEGFITHLRTGDALPAPVIEGLSDSESNGDENDEFDIQGDDKKDEDSNADEDIAGFSVENSYLAEKEDTCVALRELALHCGDSFVIYLDRSAEEVYKMVNHPHEDVKQAAIAAIVRFAITFAKSPHQSSREGFNKWIQVVVPKLSELIRTDEEYGVVMAGLEGYAELLREAGSAVLQPSGHLQAIINSVKDVMTNQTVCQDMADENESFEDGEAEQDEMLIEYAGEVIPNLGKALGHQEFAQHFPQLMPLFANKLKKSCSLAERSFSIGTLAESVEALGPSTSIFLGELLPIFFQAATDEDDEVRSNALFGLGVLGQHGGEAILGHYPALLTTLSNALSKETFPRAMDNICGAVARLISTNVERVPMEQVFPVLLQCLPIREDFEENTTLFQCFNSLYQIQHPVFMQNLQPILFLSGRIYATKQSNDEINASIQKLLSNLQKNYSEQYSSLVQGFEPELALKLQSIVQTDS